MIIVPMPPTMKGRKISLRYVSIVKSLISCPCHVPGIASSFHSFGEALNSNATCTSSKTFSPTVGFGPRNEATVSFVQSKNAISPIFVTDAGIVSLVKSLQSKNAFSPISPSPSGKFTLDRLRQSVKQPFGIEVIDLGISSVLIMRHLAKAFSPRFVTLAGIFSVARRVQLENAPSPMTPIVLGIFMFLRPVKSANTLSPISVTFASSISDGIFIVYVVFCFSASFSLREQDVI